MKNRGNSATGTSGLKNYLLSHPWPAEYLREGRPVERFLSFPVALSLEDLWPLVSDTSTLNGLMGLEAMKFEEREGRLYGSYEVLGIRHSWEEVPWQWEYGREITAERIFSEGIPRRLRMGITVEEEAPGTCRAGFYFGFIPRRPWWGPVLSATLANLERRFPSALAVLEARSKARSIPGASTASPPAAFGPGSVLGTPGLSESKGDAERVASIASRLKAEGREALRPRDLFGFQEFRDLFSDEFLPAEISIDVGIQNILMVDLVRSTELYQRVGNAKAFALVKRFFSA